MKFEGITDVFFDLDHTLWDFERNSALAFHGMLPRHIPGISVATFLDHYVPINRSFWERYQRNEITHNELRFGRMRQTLDIMGHASDDELILKLSSEYIESLPDNNFLNPGSLEILDYLRPSYRLHIITNGFSGVQQKKLENSGIASYFASVTDSEASGHKKPDPRMYRHALEKAAAQPETAVMIGDCLEADVQGALNCGLKAIWYAPEKPHVRNVTHIVSLDELKNYL